MVSSEFRNALKVHPTPKYKLARQAGISPQTLSHLITGYQRILPGDERLLKIAELIQFPKDKVFTNGGEK